MQTTVIDQMHREVEVVSPLFRIVSLVPSISEFLVAIGLEESLVGVTKFCVHPRRLLKEKVLIGGTKQLNIAKIQALNPDLIIGNKEENTLTDIDALAGFAPIYMSDINSLEEAYEFMECIGKLCGKEENTLNLISEIRNGFESIKNLSTGSFVYLIWKDPYFAVGKNTYIDAVLTHLGYKNCILQDRYPEISEELKPDYLFLSSEPFPFSEKHIEEVSKKFPESKIIFIDGEMCSWYGSRMLLAANYFRVMD
jgi:ABC-type Fe3+-hydroxamate transport system substrate-binding protein